MGKTSKTNDKWEVCKQRSVEALAICLCEHLGVIKLLAIQIETMEAYTLWWNGRTIKKMLDYNTKYSPIMDNHILLWQGGLELGGQTWLVTFRWNRVKLAWTFINIMNVIHHFGILHNDVSKDNIMLHFPLDKLDVVYIGMCDWVKVRCLWEVITSLYGFENEQDATNAKKLYWWVATELFFLL